MSLTIADTNDDRSLLSISEVRAAVGLDSEDSSKDSVLNPINNYVSAMITKACKVAKAGIIPPTLRDETVTETFVNKSLQRSLVLARRPVIEIISVTQSGSELSETDYIVDAAAGVLYRTGTGWYSDHLGPCSYWSAGDAVVEYSAGYEEVPDDLKYAAIKFIQSEYVTGDRDPRLKSLRIDGVSERTWWVSDKPVSSAVPSDVMDILARGGYVNPVIA